jgi:hypothetical protein
MEQPPVLDQAALDIGGIGFELTTHPSSELAKLQWQPFL